MARATVCTRVLLDDAIGAGAIGVPDIVRSVGEPAREVAEGVAGFRRDELFDEVEEEF